MNALAIYYYYYICNNKRRIELNWEIKIIIIYIKKHTLLLTHNFHLLALYLKWLLIYILIRAHKQIYINININYIYIYVRKIYSFLLSFSLTNFNQKNKKEHKNFFTTKWIIIKITECKKRKYYNSTLIIFLLQEKDFNFLSIFFYIKKILIEI